ncbi:hypothetical protein ACN2A0_02515 [Aerococcus viridans]
MTEILRLESPLEVLRNRHHHTLKEINLCQGREKRYLEMAFEAKKEREELERSLLMFERSIEKLGEE